MVSMDFLCVSVFLGHYQTASDSTVRIVSVANITYANDLLGCAYKNVSVVSGLIKVSIIRVF